MEEALALFELPPPNWSGEWIVRRVGPETSVPWFETYHYLAGVPSSAWCFGVFCPDMIACVAVGSPSNEHGVQAKYDLGAWQGNREIVRVAVHPDAPTNTASRAVAMSVRLLHETTEHLWVFSYADTGQGHHGGIYQALGAVYLGISGARPGYLLDGKPIHPRTVVSRFKSHSREAIAQLQRNGIDIVPVDGLNSAKHLYVLPIAEKATNRAIRKHLEPMTLPYPKREVASG